MESTKVIELELEGLLNEQMFIDVVRQPERNQYKGHYLQTISGDVFIWIQHVEVNTDQTLKHTIKSCAEFIMADGESSNRRAWIFATQSSYTSTIAKNFVLVAEIVHSSEESLDLEAKRLRSLANLPWSWWSRSSRRVQYTQLNTSSTDDQEQSYSICHRRTFQFHPVCVAFFCALVLALVLLGTMLAIYLPDQSSRASPWPEDGYIRYPTPGSDGPKRQGRIYYHNASEWSLNNPHDNGEWRIRLDDQALVPAAAWDDEEDRFQQWYHSRYPEMSEVIRTKKFIRPSWLGSPQILVKWDKEYHFAHCVLSLRRYWKAKETGRHVCPRDIDYNHIQHCLNWFEGVAFTEGTEATIPEMSEHMIWQTKICF